MVLGVMYCYIKINYCDLASVLFGRRIKGAVLPHLPASMLFSVKLPL